MLCCAKRFVNANASASAFAGIVYMRAMNYLVQNMHLPHGPPAPMLLMTSNRARQATAKHTWRMTMKTILSTLVALSVLAGIAAAPASAFDAKSFYSQQDRAHY